MPETPMHRLMPLFALCAFTLLGCRQAGDPAATTIRLDGFGDRVEIAPAAPAAPAAPRATALVLPSDFPGDVHLPERYAIDHITEVPGTRIVNLLAKGQVGRLSHDTRQAMEAAGWQRQLVTLHGGDSAVLAFEKDGRSALFAFDRNRSAQPMDDAGVIISVQLQGGAAPP